VPEAGVPIPISTHTESTVMDQVSDTGGLGLKPDRHEPSLVDLGSTLLRHRFLVTGCAALFFGAAVLTTWKPRTYTASASFSPESQQRVPAGLAGLASQFGLGLGVGDAGQTPAFYLDLLDSREILGAVAETTYSFRADTGLVSGSILDIFKIRGRTGPLRREAAIRFLRGMVSAAVSPRTNVVTVRVHSTYAQLAVQVCEHLLGLVNRFNLGRRQSQAAAERVFVAGRLEEVKSDLKQAEDRLQTFLQRNRDYRNSPELSFQQDRLARDVSMQQQVYTSLSQSFEQARIEEVRDTPVITIVERPELPVLPDPRGLLRRSIVALVIGTIVGTLLALYRDFLSRHLRRDPGDRETFNTLREETLADLRHPVRAVLRAVRRPRRARDVSPH